MTGVTYTHLAHELVQHAAEGVHHLDEERNLKKTDLAEKSGPSGWFGRGKMRECNRESPTRLMGGRRAWEQEAFLNHSPEPSHSKRSAVLSLGYPAATACDPQQPSSSVCTSYRSHCEFHPTAAGSPGSGTSAPWRLRQTCPAQMLSRQRCFPPLECCKVRSGTGSTARPFPPFSLQYAAVKRSRGVLPRVGRALQVRCRHTQVPVLQHERAAHQVLHCECVGRTPGAPCTRPSADTTPCLICAQVNTDKVREKAIDAYRSSCQPVFLLFKVCALKQGLCRTTAWCSSCSCCHAEGDFQVLSSLFRIAMPHFAVARC